MESFLDEYIGSSISKDDSPSLLLALICKNYNFNIGCIIVNDNKQLKTISFYDKNRNITDLNVNFSKIDTYKIFTDGCLYFKNYIPENGIIIPIYNLTNILGYIYFLNSSNTIDNDIIKKFTGTIYICQNIITKYKQSISTRDLFLANVSHEIRTPLNGIVGYSQLLAQTNLDITQKNYVSSINQCSTQLIQIINDILDYSKLASGKMKIKEECFNIKEIIENVLDAISYKIKEKRIKYTYNIDRNIPDYIISDKNKITQIIVNLLSNAIKFTNQGGSVSLHINKKDDNYIKITVSDTGIGISEDDQKNIFNDYSQGNESISTKYGGTGLGLSISKKLTELLGGSINFTSEYGKGSEFYFTIKYISYESGEVKMVKNTSILKDKYALVVDDNVSNRVILNEILFEWGMKPIMCASAFEAIRMIAGNRYEFSVGLIDICMPITNGIELAKQIKLENSNIPLIALSSLDDVFTKTEPLEFEDKIYKPINKIQLYQSLEKVLLNPTNNTKQTNSPKIFNKHNSNHINILIAEDVIYNQKLLENMLQSLGYNNIKSVGNGKEVLDEIKLRNYDIILLDLRMPEIDGFEVIKVLNENKSNINIIPVTASILDEDREKCKKMGISTFLTKPIDIKELKSILLEISK